MQSIVFKSEPSQDFPPFDGDGFVHVLVCVDIPGPHSLSHAQTVLQSDQPLSLFFNPIILVVNRSISKIVNTTTTTKTLAIFIEVSIIVCSINKKNYL